MGKFIFLLIISTLPSIALGSGPCVVIMESVPAFESEATIFQFAEMLNSKDFDAAVRLVKAKGRFLKRGQELFPLGLAATPFAFRYRLKGDIHEYYVPIMWGGQDPLKCPK